MPRYFHFHSNDGEVVFNAPLQCARCTYRKPLANGNEGPQCRRNACIGLPYCYQHLQVAYHVRIADSDIPHAGKGLFAWNPHAEGGGEHPIVFRRGDPIVPYDGELLNNHQLDARYGEYTGPYALQVLANNAAVRDGALSRTVGSLINHTARNRANAEFVVDRARRTARIRATKPIRHGQEILINYGREYRFNEPVQYALNGRKYNLG